MFGAGGYSLQTSSSSSVDAGSKFGINFGNVGSDNKQLLIIGGIALAAIIAVAIISR